MGKSIERVAVGTVVFSVCILTIVGLMAIWQWIDSDAIWKSFTTIGVIGLAALVVVGITRVAGAYGSGPSVPAQLSPAWKSMRNFILGVVGLIFLCFTVLSILSIWDFVGQDSLEQALQSMFLLFVSAVIILVAFKSQE